MQIGDNSATDMFDREEDAFGSIIVHGELVEKIHKEIPCNLNNYIFAVRDPFAKKKEVTSNSAVCEPADIIMLCCIWIPVFMRPTTRSV